MQQRQNLSNPIQTKQKKKKMNKRDLRLNET